MSGVADRGRRARLGVLAGSQSGGEHRLDRLAAEVAYSDFPELAVIDGLALAFRALEAGRACDRRYLQAVIDGASDLLRAGEPRPAGEGWPDLASEAQGWAAWCGPAELVAYARAVLAALHDAGRPIPPAPLKGAFVGIWDRLSAEDRRAFLAKVDPQGKFRRAA